MRGIVIFVALLGSTFLGAHIARAQAPSESSQDDEARALFAAGHTAFEDGRFADALTDFQRAYDLSHRPDLLYNVGQCHDRLRHDAEALAAFEGYLAAVPDAPARHMIEARMAILREAVAHAAVAPPPSEATPDAAPPITSEPPAEPTTLPPRSGDPTGWILVGVGAGVAVVGAILVGVAFADINSVQSAIDVPYSRVRDANERSPIESGVGWAALGIGAAVAVAGIIMLATSGGSSERPSVSLFPGGLAISGVF